MAAVAPLTAPAPLKVVVLTSRRLGVELAALLQRSPAVGSLTVVTTRLSPVRRSLIEKARAIHRYDGLPGVMQSFTERLRRLRGPNQANDPASAAQRHCPGARHIHLPDLHAPDSIAQLRALKADLGVVFATYLLRPEVFTVPRLGCLNLHLGRAPEFRGSSPGFYEMLEGVPEVGVTIHRVSEKLDGGPILLQETLPLELAPTGDPIAYLRRYQAEVLVPEGSRLMVRAVEQLMNGTAQERPQQATGQPPRRRATYRLKQELRRRVAQRRREAGV